MKDFYKNFPEINRNAEIPLYAQLSDSLEKYIIDNKPEVGSPLPTETDLIKFYSVSRITARKAMQRLATKGLIKKVQGKGTFVAEPKYSDLLSGIESLEEKFEKKGIKIVNVPIEVGVAHPIDHWLKNLNLSGEDQAFGIVRQKKINENILCVEYKFITLEIANLFDVEELKYEPLINLFRRYSKTEIFYAKYKTYSTSLFSRDATNLKVKTGSPALIRTGTYYNSIRKPLITGRKAFPADKIEIEFEVSNNNVINESFTHK
ncbi:GntR family transcriptional regulator [Thermodesulfobacteriota bacterium]